jgi:hypothetical protein
MGSLAWLKLSRKLPGLNRQPEYPHLEALIEQEGQNPSSDFMAARWLVPLILTTVGVSVFTPLMIFVHPLFVIGLVGLPLLGVILGLIFHSFVRSVTPARIKLRRQCRKLGEKLIGWKNLLGIESPLSQEAGEILDEAAMIYLKVQARSTGFSPNGTMTEPHAKAERALENAMSKMLELSEQDSAALQNVSVAGGWASQLLEEMRALDAALEASERSSRAAELIEADTFAQLRETREEIQMMDSAVIELRQSIED